MRYTSPSESFGCILVDWHQGGKGDYGRKGNFESEAAT